MTFVLFAHIYSPQPTALTEILSIFISMDRLGGTKQYSKQSGGTESALALPKELFLSVREREGFWLLSSLTSAYFAVPDSWERSQILCASVRDSLGRKYLIHKAEFL